MNPTPQKNIKVIHRKVPYTPKNIKVIRLLKRKFKRYYFLNPTAVFLGIQNPTTVFWESQKIANTCIIAQGSHSTES